MSKLATKPALQQATMVLLILLTTSAAWAAHSDWQEGQFLSGGKPVSEHHCAPSTPGVHPAVILLHGGAGYGPGEFDIENLCSDLAERGYYVESIEYFSQSGGELGPFTGDEVANAPIFMREVESGIDALGKNAAVDSKRIGMMGYSYGATLSLAIGAQEPGKIAAIVDYYGKLPPQLEQRAGNLPPTLIMHGGSDDFIPVANARRLDTLMTSANRPHEVHIFPGLGHGFNFKGSTVCPADPCLRFLDEHLNPGTASTP